MSRITILITIILIIDLYTFRGLRLSAINWNTTLKYIVYFAHWLVPAFLISTMFFHFRQPGWGKEVNSMNNIFFIVGFFVLFYVPKLVYVIILLVEDTGKILALIVKALTPEHTQANNVAAKISRSDFLARLGLIIAAIPFLSVIYGMAHGRFNFSVRREVLKFKNLPKAFNGFKVLQISDFHIGSFHNNEAEVEAAVVKINEQQADIVVFTGDMVNHLADELKPFIGILGKIEAKHGKYSVLGNHDYADYYRHWESQDAKKDNLNKLISYQQQAGFNLLKNDAVKLNIGNEQIAVIGVENWGEHPFPQYGDYDKASEKVKDTSFKILLSHDPTHWDNKIVGKTDVDVTLSGHTHGMQFGISIPGMKWSPVKFRYPRWSGLYKEKKQYLYVNIGIGFIAFPGRVGMPPEITVLELFSDNKDETT